MDLIDSKHLVAEGGDVAEAAAEVEEEAVVDAKPLLGFPTRYYIAI